MTRCPRCTCSTGLGMQKVTLRLVLLGAITCFAATEGLAAANAKPSLDEALAQLQVPPAWFDEVKVQYDTNQPWKDARLEVRRLLSLNQNREAIKLTVLYVRKGDIGDGQRIPHVSLHGRRVCLGRTGVPQAAGVPSPRIHA